MSYLRIASSLIARVALGVALGVGVGLVGLGSPALAQDPSPRPSTFFGTVTDDGAPVPAGSSVTAFVDGTECSATTTFLEGADSVFRLDVPADAPDTPEIEGGAPGQAVTFRIDGAIAEEAASSGLGFTYLFLNKPTPAARRAVERAGGVVLWIFD